MGLKKFTFTLSPKAYGDLCSLAKSHALSMSQLLRIALSLIYLLITEKAKGNKMIIASSDGVPLKEIDLP